MEKSTKTQHAHQQKTLRFYNENDKIDQIIDLFFKEMSFMY